MAKNEFEKATNNYGNNFSNNGGNHYYTTYGHKYDDSTYTLAKFNGQVDPIAISSTKNGYPNNTVGLTTYGQGYLVNLIGHSHVDDYTQTITLGWPNNINTKGKIEGALSFAVSTMEIPASGGAVNITLPSMKLTGTRDTKGYRYSDVTLKPEVPSNPDTLDDDGTAAANATVLSTTYVGENRQGFLNYREPKIQYPIYLSYVDKPNGAVPFFEMSSVPTMSDGINPIEGITTTQGQIFTYSYWYDNVGRDYAYAYAPYGDLAQYKKPGPSWNYKNVTLSFVDNFLSTYPKVMTLSYTSNIALSYDGGTFPFDAKFVCNGTYQNVTTSTPTDTGFTTYDRYVKVYDANLLSIENSTTTPTYVGVAYTIHQSPATLTKWYNWSLPEIDGKGKNNFDSKTNAKYVSLAGENNYIQDGESTTLTVARQDHYKGTASGKLDFITLPLTSDRILYMSHNSTKECRFGGVDWTDCENREERTFYVRCSSKFENYRNQNITSITNEYSFGDVTKPEVTLKCTQLPAQWEHPIFRGFFNVKNQYNNDNTVLPRVMFKTKGNNYYNTYGATSNAQRYFNWSISSSSMWPDDVSSVDASNRYLSASIYIPTHSMPWVKGKVNSGSTVTTSLASDKLSCDGDLTAITYTFALNANQGYNKGFERQQWKLTLEVYVTTFVAMNNKLTPFDPITIEMNAQESNSYTWPTVTMGVSRTNTDAFFLNRDQIIMGGETGKDVSTSLFKDSPNNTTVTGSVNVECTSNNKERGTWNATLADNGDISISSTFKNKDSRSTTVTIGNPTVDSNSEGASNITVSNKSFDITQYGESWDETITFTQSGNGSKTTGTWTVPLPANTSGNATRSTSRWGLKSKQQRYLTGIGSLKITNKSNIPSGGSVTISTSGSYTTDSAADKTLSWSVSAKLSTTPSAPSSNSDGVIGSGTITPLDPSCTIQYSSDKNSDWSNSSTINVGSNTGSMTKSPSINRNTRTGADICNGAWDYTAGYYTGKDDRDVKLQVRVVDDNDSTITYDCDDVTVTQNGDSNSTGARGSNFEFEVYESNNCTCGTPSSTNQSTKDISSVGKFTVSLSGYSDGSYTKKQDWMDEFNNSKSGITSQSENFALNTKSPNEDGKQFGYNDDIDYTMSVTGKGNIYIGTTEPYTWTWTYYYKVRRKDNHNDSASSGDLTGKGNYSPANATLYSPKYQWYKDGTAISGATYSSYKAISVGIYRCDVKWLDGYVKSATWSVTKESDNTQYRYKVVCTMTPDKDATVDAWTTKSKNFKCGFSADIYMDTSNIEGTEWNNNWTKISSDDSVTINESNVDITPTNMGTSSSTTGDNSFTFKLSGFSYTTVEGTTECTVHYYRYGKSYYNS